MEGLAEASGHDAVALGDRHQDPALEARQMSQTVVAVLQQPFDRQPGVVEAGKVLQPVPWRDQQQPRRPLALAHACSRHHGGPQRFAGEQQRLAIELVRECDGLFGIGNERLFAHLAAARTVARVLGENHAQAQRGERGGVEVTVSGMPGIAVKDDHRGARRARCFRHQTAEVLGRRPGAKVVGDQFRQWSLVGKVEQAVLEHGDPGNHEHEGDNQSQHAGSISPAHRCIRSRNLGASGRIRFGRIHPPTMGSRPL